MALSVDGLNTMDARRQASAEDDWVDLGHRAVKNQCTNDQVAK